MKEVAAVWEDINSLVMWEQNPRHNNHAIQSVADSIKRFGFGAPIVAREADKMVIAGHTRLEAAKRLGLDRVPVRYLDLDPADAKMLALADNKIGELADWDSEALEKIIGDLGLSVDDMADLGWSSSDLDDLFDPVFDPIDDEPVDVCEDTEPVSMLGDVYRLGRHTLVCGDCTDVKNWPKGEFRIVCDPPYGLGDTVSDKNNYDAYSDTKESLISIIDRLSQLIKKAVSCVVTCGNEHQRLWPDADWVMAWFTPAGVGRGPWGFCCWQPILCYGKDPKLANGLGSHPDALTHTESSEKFGHPCTKPINFWTWLVERATIKGDIVLDLFGGSGTTLIACHNTSRTAYMIEIDPKYCDIIRRRWFKYATEHNLDVGDGLDG